MECSVCGISGKNTRLLDAISSSGIVKVCGDCSEKEDMPVLRRPTTFQLKEAEKRPRYMYPKEPKKEFEEQNTKTTLKEIVDKNYEASIFKEKGPRIDLIDNFHWVLMRARRLKKITQEQLAKEISESTAAIKMAEEGILPEDDYRLVNKLESFLGVKILKNEARSKLADVERKFPARILKFDAEAMKGLTISDLKEMKDKREKPVEDFEENKEETEEIGESEVL